MTITIPTYRPTASAAPSAATYSLFPITYSLNYAFSAKERDVETGLSYFGARYYSSDLSIWLSVDPMSDKYPSLSPYVYCADNPVRYVDPNGREIIIEWRGARYTYNPDKGALFDSEGKIYNGKKKFLTRACSALNEIKRTSEGGKIISSLHDSQEKYYIKARSSSDYDYVHNTVTWCSNGIKHSILGTCLGNADPSMDLAHELSHAYDDVKQWGTCDKYENTDVDACEWVACYRENLIRGELGKQYRTYYDVQKTSDDHFIGGTGQYLLDDTDKPYLPFNLSDYEK